MTSVVTNPQVFRYRRINDAKHSTTRKISPKVIENSGGYGK